MHCRDTEEEAITSATWGDGQSRLTVEGALRGHKIR